jgi:hypothetical protein
MIQYPAMADTNAKLLFPVLESLVLVSIAVAVPVIVAQDIEVFRYGNSEVSVTELTQEALILLSAVLSGLSAWKYRVARSWLLLVTGLFSCMFLREIDFWLDKIAHGFWVYPVGLIVVATIANAVRNRDGLISSATAYAMTRSHAYIAVGLAIVLLFSRLAGTSRFWMQVMGDNYHASYKTFMQEGLELLGYFLIALGSVTLIRQLHR